MKKRSILITIPNNVIRTDLLSLGALGVITYLCGFINSEDLTIDYMLNEMNVKEDDLISYLYELDSYGYIDKFNLDDYSFRSITTDELYKRKVEGKEA